MEEGERIYVFCRCIRNLNRIMLKTVFAFVCLSLSLSLSPSLSSTEGHSGSDREADQGVGEQHREPLLRHSVGHGPPGPGTDRPTDRPVDKSIGRSADRPVEDIHTYRQNRRQTQIQIGRHADIQTHRQTDKTDK